MRISWRKETASDEAFLHQLIVASVAGELQASEWPPEVRQPVLEMQYRARRQGLRSNFPDAESRIVLVDGEPAGWLVVSDSNGEIRLVDIAILPEQRNRGIGSAVIQELLAVADRTGKPVRLTVSTDNPAARLYERLGFRRTGGSELQHFMERPAAGKGDVE